MDNHLESGQMYIIFEVEDSTLAVPISETLVIMQEHLILLSHFCLKLPNFIRCVTEIE